MIHCIHKETFPTCTLLDLQDEETGAWYQHRGRDFKVPLVDCLHEDNNIVGGNRGFGIWPGHGIILFFLNFFISAV